MTYTSIPIRILIVDDHTILRAGLQMLLESQAGLHVVGQAGTSHDALASAAQELPDIILLDIDLGGESGLDLLPKLLQVVPRTRVIMLTSIHDLEVLEQAIHRGALGVVLKDQASEVLHKAIVHVQAGGTWVEAALARRMLSGITSHSATQKPDPETAKIASLTQREREVIEQIGLGLTNKQIAKQLSLSATTVNHHLTAIYTKLNVSNRLDLMIYANRHGLVKARR